MSDKYLYYSGGPSAGINHLTSNLTTFLSEASLLNRTPIIPIFHLAGSHNRRIDGEIKNHLDRYYDFRHIKVEGKPLKVILSSEISIPKNSDKTLIITENQIITDKQNQQFNFIIRNMKIRLWRFAFSKNYARERLRVTIPVNENILKAATDAGKILKNYYAIHIRRTDKLKIVVMLNYYTSPKAIIKKLAKIIPPSAPHNLPKPVLYLMSDEQKPGFFDEVGQHYQLKRWFDLEPVKTAVAEFADDNYFLYAIERAIFGNADIKIDTFGKYNIYHLYPNFLLKPSNFFHNYIRSPYRRFLLLFYRLKPSKSLFRKIFRRDKIYK